MRTIIKEVDYTLPFYFNMALGHQSRTGHELIAHLESETGEFWKLVRKCC